jgi:hypothetical protein
MFEYSNLDSLIQNAIVIFSAWRLAFLAVLHAVFVTF